MDEEEFDAIEEEFSDRIDALVDEYWPRIGPGTHPDDDPIDADDLKKLGPSGWVLVVEGKDLERRPTTAQTRYSRLYQAPSHSVGMLRYALRHLEDL